MRYAPLSSSFFCANRRRLMERMPKGSIAIFHANDRMPTNADGSMPYCANSDLFYLTGLEGEGVSLALFPDAPNPRRRELLFIEEITPERARWEGSGLSKAEAAQRAGVDAVFWQTEFDALLRELMRHDVSAVLLNINEHARTKKQVETANARFARLCKARFPLHRYERAAPLMAALRVTKQPEEIATIRQACRITEQGFRRALGFIRPGVKEYEIEAEYLYEFVRRGSRGFAYEPIVASGADNCVLHYTRNDKLCKAGDLILLDVAAEYGRYNADLTRTVPVSGRFTLRQKAVYNATLRVLRYAIQLMVPGLVFADYQREVGQCMEEELAQLGLIDLKAARPPGSPAAYRRYFYHGVSHLLGLDVHDVGVAQGPMPEGSVWTVEPGIYIPEEGFGIRLENNVVIGSKQAIDLTANIPIEAEEVEALMGQQGAFRAD